jgi:uncharacterized membrane protein YkoI
MELRRKMIIHKRWHSARVKTISEQEVMIMRYLSVILTALGLLGFATISAGQEKKVEATIVLPEAVTRAIGETFPNAEIDTMDVEEEAGVTVYDIELKAGMGELDVAADGTIIEVTTFIKMADVPAAAAAVIQKAASGATIKEIEKAEIHAEIKKEGEIGRIVKIKNPSCVYEVELAKGKQVGEIQVAPDGTITEALKWRDRGVEEDIAD